MPWGHYARMAIDAGVKLSVNTDAHHVEHFERLPYGIATAARACLGARLDFRNRNEPFVGDRPANISFRHVIAGTDLCIFRHRGRATERSGCPTAAAQQIARLTGQRVATLGKNRQRSIIGCVAHQDAA